MLAYQFELKLNKKQIAKFDKQLELHRSLYNYCLELKRDAWQNNKVNITGFDLIKSQVPLLKGMSNSASLQQTVRRLDKAYSEFFKKNSKIPRFKSEDRFNTINFIKDDGIKIKNESIYIQYISESRKDLIPVKFNRKLCGEIISLSITRRLSKYFVNIVCESSSCIQMPTGLAIGIDFGISTSFTFSNEDKVESPSWRRDKQKQVARLTRNENWKALAKVHAKIANRRKDFNHKLSRKLVDKYDIICVENLKVNDIKVEGKKLKKNKNINSKLCNVGINQFISFLKYKAENAGKKVVMVDPAYTTQTCHGCGSRQHMELSERVYKCACGVEIDRDVNAALNILRLGLESVGEPSGL